MADSARHALYYDAESTYGTTETSPGFNYFRHTGCTLGVNKETNVSEELYSDRGIRDERHGNKNVVGDVNAELSYNSFNDILEALIGGTWSTSATSVTATTISATASGNTIDDSASGFGSISAGDMVLISGFTGTTANNGVARVTAASAASLTIDGRTLTDEAAGDSVTIRVMDKLTSGTTRRSFSLIRDFADLTNGRYQLFSGCEFNSGSLNFGLGAIISAVFGIIGQNQSSSASAPSGATFGSAGTTEPFISYDGSLNEAGSASSILTNFTIDVNNGLEPKFHLGSSETSQPGIGRHEVTGEITAYFDDDTLLAKFLNETESNLLSSLTDAAGNTFAIMLPRVIYNGGQPDVGGEANTPINLPYRALHDSTTSNATIIIAKEDA